MKCFMFLLMNFKLFVWGFVLVGFDTIEWIDFIKSIKFLCLIKFVKVIN